MKNVSQFPRKPVTGLIKDMLDGWRRGLQLSQSKIVARVVEAHKAIDGERVTELLFEEERQGRDLTHCQKINMQKVYRWLGADNDDDEAPGNMPVNFLPSVLASLPMSLRVQLANEILAPCGLSVRPMVGAEAEFSPDIYLSDIIREGAEATQAVATLLICGKSASLAAAQKELTESIAAQQKALMAVEAQISNSDGVA